MFIPIDLGCSQPWVTVHSGQRQLGDLQVVRQSVTVEDLALSGASLSNLLLKLREHRRRGGQKSARGRGWGEVL